MPTPPAVSERLPACRIYWQMCELQMPEQQSKSVAHESFVSPQQPHGSNGDGRH
jgi:hypothetical protein